MPATAPSDLDPQDWPGMRRQAHRMLDDMLDYICEVRQRNVWMPMPDAVRENFRREMPRQPVSLENAHREFCDFVLPYAGGNIHPGFMGWVQGGGTPVGMVAEMLAGGLNANLGGRDHAPIAVERQVVAWMRDLFHFPDTASGLFVTGTSIANFLAVLVARNRALGTQSRVDGVGGSALRAYTSQAAHGCVTRAFEMAGLGSASLIQIPTDSLHRMDLGALRQAIARDRAKGLAPFMVIGSAGTVDVGAIDDLEELAQICRDEQMWLHVDGAYGALGILAPGLAPRLQGLCLADSIAFDFHKWGQVPYDAGFLLVRDGRAHLETFSAPASYLRRDDRGMAAGSPWPCDFGPDLSRGFRALKTWLTLKVMGVEAIGAAIDQMCNLARHLERRIREAPELELLAPAQLNIVCFRYRADDADALNSRLVVLLQETGIAAPSTTIVGGKVAIRAALFNHRTTQSDVDMLLSAVLGLGAALCHEAAGPAGQCRISESALLMQCKIS